LRFFTAFADNPGTAGDVVEFLSADTIAVGVSDADEDGGLFDFHRLGFENGDELIQGGTAKDAGFVTTHLVGEVVLADQVDNSSFDFERGEFVWQAVNKDFDAGFQSFGANILDGLNFFGF